MPVLTDELANRIDKLIVKLDASAIETARLNASVEVLKSRLDSSLLVAKWAIGLLATVVLASAPAVFGIYRDVAVLNASVGELKQTVNRIESKIDRLGQIDLPKTESPRR